MTAAQLAAGQRDRPGQSRAVQVSRPSPACPPPPSPTERLRSLARRVRRLSLAGRLGTEDSYIERDAVARALLSLARELEA